MSGRIARFDLGDHEDVAVRVQDPHLPEWPRGAVKNLPRIDPRGQQLRPQSSQVARVQVEQDPLAAGSMGSPSVQTISSAEPAYQALNSFQCPSETTSTAPSVNLMAV